MHLNYCELFCCYILFLLFVNVNKTYIYVYRKHCEILRFSDLESEFEDCDLEDAVALETKLRKVARRNSLSHEEMMKLLHVSCIIHYM